MIKAKALTVGENHIKTDTNTGIVEVALEVFFIPEGDYIVSYCPALDLSSFGKTERESRTNFEDAIELFLKETHQRGTLEKVLLDLGWGLKKLPTPKYVPPTKHTSIMVLPKIKDKKASFRENVRIPVN